MTDINYTVIMQQLMQQYNDELFINDWGWYVDIENPEPEIVKSHIVGKKHTIMNIYTNNHIYRQTLPTLPTIIEDVETDSPKHSGVNDNEPVFYDNTCVLTCKHVYYNSLFAINNIINRIIIVGYGILKLT